MRVAVDIGGTFTDLVVVDDHGRLRTTKTLTTPENHVLGVQHACEKLDVTLQEVDLFIHGSTIAINTVVEKRGARTGLITTAGFRDIYEIGRGNRPQAYHLHFHRPEPLVPRDLRVEVRERMNARGEVLVPLDEASVAAAVAALEAAGIESVAVCLLHAYANPAHEERIGRVLAERHPEWYLSLSHQILREIREYERTSTTVLNAYIGPIVSRYLASLEGLLHRSGPRGSLLVMQSNGGLMSSHTARTVPIAMMESGPVAGVMGAASVGRRLGHPDIISFDMGGTTAKASVVRGGELEMSTAYYIGGYAAGQPMMLPTVDIVEVGAGGGSLAWIDGAGALKVGPQSAGARPGPACFGQGGVEPTVTDANVVLGRIDPEDFLGGELKIDQALAEAALKRVAGPLGMSVVEAALGIVTIADAKMALAVRAISVERGRDPRDFALLTSGGGGPLHGTSIARDLAIPVVIVPCRPAVFSAEGLLNTPLRHDDVQTALGELDHVDLTALGRRLDEMEERAAARLAQEGAARAAMRFARLLDLRYTGQEFALAVEVDGRLGRGAGDVLRRRFDELHERRYGHSAPGEPVEVVNLRLRSEAALPPHPQLAAPTGEGTAGAARTGTRRIVFEEGAAECPVFIRDRLPARAEVVGPAVIQEYGTATLLHRGDVAVVGEGGHLIVRVAGTPAALGPAVGGRQ